jgi:hypothetical protein
MRHRNAVPGGLAIALLVTAAGILSPTAVAVASSVGHESLAAPTWAAGRFLDYPGGRTDSSAQALGAVSCTSAGFCEALAGLNTPKAAEWNGSTWQVQPMPTPSGGSGLQMNAVSCTAPDACEAVGYYTNKIGAYQPVVEDWDGTAWSAQAVLAPGGKDSGDGMLNGLSCVTASACEAGGTYLLDGDVVTLAEVWHGHTWQQWPWAIPGTRRATSGRSPRRGTGRTGVRNRSPARAPHSTSWGCRARRQMPARPSVTARSWPRDGTARAGRLSPSRIQAAGASTAFPVPQLTTARRPATRAAPAASPIGGTGPPGRPSPCREAPVRAAPGVPRST